MSADNVIYLDGGDWDIDEDVSEKLASTGEFGPPAAPLTGGEGLLVATLGSTTAIDPALKGTLAPRTGAPTRYAVTLQGDQIAATLAGFVGQTVWRLVMFGTDYRRWVPFRVLAGRR